MFCSIHALEQHHLSHEFNIKPNMKEKTFTSIDRRKTKDQTEVTCSLCRRVFLNRRALAMHTRRQHNDYAGNKNTAKTIKSSTKIGLSKTSKMKSIMKAKIKAKYNKRQLDARSSKAARMEDIVCCPYCPKVYSNKNST